MASSLIESMRDVGYSLETALADIIDNSITAKSTRVDIFCDADASEPAIGILDNGVGMNEEELKNAMRPGSRSPLDNREKGDLGRFGLGMKTASFSQCRRLTVVSKQNSEFFAIRWDLDFVAEENDWLLQMPTKEEVNKMPFIERLGDIGDKGTLVIWQKMDRLNDQTHNTLLKNYLYEQIDRSRLHLELVFHRFITGENKIPKVVICINNRKIEAIDPFNSKHPATRRLPDEKIKVAGLTVRVRPYILPHHKKASKKDWEKHAGEGGYLQNQGFYIYRAGRLIVHGTWFRLATKSELTKLARVKVDMPTKLDHLWKIDVKKASASPPLIFRKRLKGIIDKITEPSRETYIGRGRKIVEPGLTPVWIRRVDKNLVSYEINREHPVISGFLNKLEEEQAKSFIALLAAVEKMFPADALFSDMANNPEEIDKPSMTDDELVYLLGFTVSCLRDSGLTNPDIVEKLRGAEPYRSVWQIAEPKLKYILEENHQ